MFFLLSFGKETLKFLESNSKPKYLHFCDGVRLLFFKFTRKPKHSKINLVFFKLLIHSSYEFPNKIKSSRYTTDKKPIFRNIYRIGLVILVNTRGASHKPNGIQLYSYKLFLNIKRTYFLSFLLTPIK